MENLYSPEIMREYLDKMLKESTKEAFVTRNFVENALLTFSGSNIGAYLSALGKDFETYKKIMSQLFGVDEILIFDLGKVSLNNDEDCMIYQGYIRTSFKGMTSKFLSNLGSPIEETEKKYFAIFSYIANFKYKDHDFAIKVPPIHIETSGEYISREGDLIEYKEYIRDDANMFDFLFKEVRKTVEEVDKGFYNKND